MPLQWHQGGLSGTSKSFELVANGPVQLRLERVRWLERPEGVPAAEAPGVTLLGRGPYRVALELVSPAGGLLPPGYYSASVDIVCIPLPEAP